MAAKRSAHSRTFAMPDGSRVVQVSPGTLNVRDKTGAWVPVSASWVRRKDGSATMGPAPVGVTLPAHIEDAPVSVSHGSERVAMRYLGARGAARVTGDLTTYASVRPGVDVSYAGLPNGVKESIEVSGADVPRVFDFSLDLSAGLSAQEAAGGAIRIVDDDRHVRFTLPAAYMYDKSRGPTGRRPVDMDIEHTASGLQVVLRPDVSWLRKHASTGAVVIDPTIVVQPFLQCALTDDPDWRTCGTSMMVGQFAGYEHRALMRFDLTNIGAPPDAVVTNAALTLTQGFVPDDPILIGAYPVTQAWGSSCAPSWSDSCDFLHRPWTTPGGTFGAREDVQQSPDLEATGSWNITKMAQSWLTAPGTNFGVALKSESATGLTGFAGTDNTELAPPMLSVSYEPHVGDLPANKYESQQLSDRMSLAVNSAVGNLMVRARDVTVPGGLGPDLTVSRSYNSKQSDPLAYGNGWNMDTGPDVSIDPSQGRNLVYHGPSGLRATFTYDSASGVYTSPGFNAKLVPRGGSTGWTYTENASQRKLTFDAAGRLTRDEDRNGRAITFAYNGSTKELRTITDSQGRTTTFTYASGRVTQMTDSGGRMYKYFYTGALLTKYTDPENNDTLYDYDGYGRMQLITTPAGHKTKITYYSTDPFFGRVASVIRVTNPTAAFSAMTGPTTQFNYTHGQDGSQQSVVTDPDNHAVTTDFDILDRPLDATDGNGHETSATYTTNSDVQSFTLAGTTGTTPNTALTYDTTNNLTGADTPVSSTTAPAGCTSATCIRSRAAYGEPAGVSSAVPGYQYLQTSSTDPQGRGKTYGYDAHGNPTSTASPAGAITLAYDPASAGKLTSITDARGHSTSYGYDGSGNLATITPPAPLGYTTLIYTTALSRVAKVRDGKNNIRLLTYDNLDRVTKITYADARYVQFVYDKDGNLTARNDSAGGNTTYSYDQLSRLTGEALPGGASNGYGYDAAGNLTSLTDASGTTTYGYDAANLNTGVADPAQTAATGTALHYDVNDRPDVTTYPNGMKVIRAYDYAGRLTDVQARSSAGSLIEDRGYAYTDSSPGGYGEGAVRLSMVDRLANTTTAYTYDMLNRLIRSRMYTTGTTAPDRNATCVADARRACYEYALDGAGNRTQRKVTGSDVPNSTVTMVYNDANEMTSSTGPAGTSTYGYDANGNQTTRTGAAPRTLVYNYRDQTTSLAGTAMSYLGAGQDQLVTQGTTANNLQSNVLGLARSTIGATTSYYTRDVYGNPLSRRTGSGREYYAVDALGSIVRTVDGATNATTSTNAYDPDGNTTTTGTSTNPLKYAGGYLAPAGLYHFGQRYYDPADARWTQPDPLNQPADLLEGNRYPYAGDDPIDGVDPMGTCVFGLVSCKTVHRIGNAITGKIGGAAVGCFASGRSAAQFSAIFWDPRVRAGFIAAGCILGAAGGGEGARAFNPG